MNDRVALAILAALLFAPLISSVVERNIEIFFLAVGVAATFFGDGFSRPLVSQAIREPIGISIAVFVAQIVFRFAAQPMEDFFAVARRSAPRAILTALAVFALSMLSCVITAIVAALVLVELVSLLHLEPARRVPVTVAACFGIGLGCALTPLGGPLSTLASYALNLDVVAFFNLLAPWVIPGVVASAIVAGFFARGAYFKSPDPIVERESYAQMIVATLKIFAFVVGLVLISNAFAPVAKIFVARMSDAQLYWANTVSAALDNATLVAFEVHDMEVSRAREAIVALLLAGGMLIPGNVPNIVAASAMRITSAAWARTGIAMGAVLMGIYFALFSALR